MTHSVNIIELPNGYLVTLYPDLGTGKTTQRVATNTGIRNYDQHSLSSVVSDLFELANMQQKELSKQEHCPARSEVMEQLIKEAEQE